ncbi:glycerate dehydrogenase [Chitinivorax tropicus]|uniref:Glycerate dehydrogenase n=1 Tax=Chitinivorax tropicus TaxID=714531 RepID=A0A840MNW3_9PROT|nr:D-2-hydroxyacid dehydrogenase [Chitinivorax tropicus]MBB5018442.1 glycerate dehydrogenase [Chitinivorax tropicus]
MTCKIVFLDRGSLPATLRAPRFAHEWQDYPQTSPDQVTARLQGAQIAITNKVPITRAMLQALPDLQLIAVAATGVNPIDLAACRDHGVSVCNIRDYARHTVPEHVMMLILALSRNLLAYRQSVDAGEWQQSSQFCLFQHPVRDLADMTIGIFGKGSLGEGVARLAQAFGMQVLFAERKGEAHTRPGYIPFDEVLAQADVISLHLPACDATQHTLSHREFALMKRDALVINTARGSLVDEFALAEALSQHRIGGAGLDVISQEPPRDSNPLLDLRHPNLIITPHCAWLGSGALAELSGQLIGNIESFVAGQPHNLVT